MALTSQRSRTSRTLRRLSLKLGTLVIAALAVTMALGLAAPAAGQAAVSVQRLGYCGGAGPVTAISSGRYPNLQLETHCVRNNKASHDRRSRDFSDVLPSFHM